MRSWQVQEAKARFSELLEAAMNEGPQVVTKRGADAAVVVPIDQWRRLQQSAQLTLKDLLLAEEPRFEMELPERGKLRWRRPARRS